MIFIVKDNEGKYHEIRGNSNQSQLIEVSNGTAAALLNPAKDTATVLVLADISWKPDDNEMKNVTFDNYNWDKWK